MYPVCLAETFELEIKEPHIWQYLKEGDISVDKSSFSFVAIDVNHGMEQKNSTMKLVGSKLSYFLPKLTKFTKFTKI